MPAKQSFVKACGQSLFEKCKACSGPVLLTQKFCSSCGENLEESLRARFEEAEQLMVRAVEAAKRHDYDDAISLLRRIAAPSDYRFKETAENAQQAIGKIEALRDQANSISSQTQAQALQAFEKGDQAEAAQIVGVLAGQTSVRRVQITASADSASHEAVGGSADRSSRSIRRKTL